MLTNDFQGVRLSRLGFGAMRLPLLPGQTAPTSRSSDLAGSGCLSVSQSS